MAARIVSLVKQERIDHFFYEKVEKVERVEKKYNLMIFSISLQSAFYHNI
jgi:hypothetical protein